MTSRKYPSLLEDFQTGRSINGSQETSASIARGLSGFCLAPSIRIIRSIRSIRVRIETSRGWEWFILVYRLGEDGDLKNEGKGVLSVWALRARFYKTRAEA